MGGGDAQCGDGCLGESLGKLSGYCFLGGRCAVQSMVVQSMLSISAGKVARLTTRQSHSAQTIGDRFPRLLGHCRGLH